MSDPFHFQFRQLLVSPSTKQAKKEQENIYEVKVQVQCS